MTRRVLPALVMMGMVWLGISGCCMTPCGEARTVRLLTVGNSFSRNATRFLADIAKADGNVLVHHACFIGGGSMAQHWKKVGIHAGDPNDKLGLYTDTRKSLQEELGAQKWDFVTIQQYSYISDDASTYRPYAALLYGFIKSNAPQAEVLMHQTWAYRCDDPRFSPSCTNAGKSTSQQAMYENLQQAYETVAKELGIRQIPVGNAFYAVDSDPNWGYRPDPAFNPKTAERPALPNQTHSLHVGWSWHQKTDGTWSLTMDGHHAGVAGEYLAACVFYEMLFGRNVVGNRFVPRGMSRDEIAYLQAVAHKTVMKDRVAGH